MEEKDKNEEKQPQYPRPHLGPNRLERVVACRPTDGIALFFDRQTVVFHPLVNHWRVQSGAVHHPCKWCSFHTQADVDREVAVALDELLGAVQGVHAPRIEKKEEKYLCMRVNMWMITSHLPRFSEHHKNKPK